MLDKDFSIRAKVKSGQISVVMSGGPITNGELRLLIEAIKNEHDKFIKEIRHGRVSSEQPTG
jgi:hypothetical protein